MDKEAHRFIERGESRLST